MSQFESVFFSGFCDDTLLIGMTPTTEGLTLALRTAHAPQTCLLTGDYKLLSDKNGAADQLSKHVTADMFTELRNVLCTDSKRNIRDTRQLFLSRFGDHNVHIINENLFHLKNWKLKR